MRLLVVCQSVDTDDPVLGFFHHWLETFAPKFESIEAICLSEGRHALPGNVRVHSLGKEQGSAPSFIYALRFYRRLYELRGSYDAVFVHMNPEYVVLAGILWRLSGKKVGLWYNHTNGSLPLRLAALLSSVIFHTSPYAYPARYRQAKRMPAGIDTNLFSPRGTARVPRSVYFQGRVAPAKKVHVLLAALRLLRDRGAHATATIVGPIDHSYGLELHRMFDDLLDGDGVSMQGPKRNEETPALYSSHAAAVNLTADGNYDKVVLEALACGTPMVLSSKAFSDLVPPERTVPHDDENALADALDQLFSLSEEERAHIGREGREAVIRTHSLSALADALALEYGA